MDPVEKNKDGVSESLPPPPPVPPNVVPIQVAPEQPSKKKVMRLPVARKVFGTKGQKIPILTNHFKVNVSSVDDDFYHYSAFICYEDGRPVDAKSIGRKVIDRVHETYDVELAGKNFAYDGEKILFTVGSLPRNKLEFTIVLEDVVSSSDSSG